MRPSARSQGIRSEIVYCMMGRYDSRMFRPSRLPWFRAALLGLLALCMALQPVLAAAGELHEAFAHADQAAFHLEGSDDHGDASGDPGDEPADALHVLLHFAHCCGHPAGLNPPEAGAHWSPVHEPRPLTAVVAPTLAPQLGSPFRPPIQA